MFAATGMRLDRITTYTPANMFALNIAIGKNVKNIKTNDTNILRFFA